MSTAPSISYSPNVQTGISVANDDVHRQFKVYITGLNTILHQIRELELAQLATLIQAAQQNQRTVFIAGNGGSASTASHWATDLGKGLHHRIGKGVKALSLSDNTAWISAAANDIGYDSIFSDQLRAHAKAGDVLIVISASGNSPNIIKALQVARDIGVTSVSIVGFDGGAAKIASDYTVHVPTDSGKYGLAEDAQLILNHFLCDYLAGAIE